jgi:hypothetical protein
MNLIKSASSNDFTGTKVDTTSEVINFNGGGLFAGDLPYPDDVTASGTWTGDDFILFAVGHIDVLEEGDYTFGVHSDDGFAYRIRGGQTISVSGNGQLDPVDPETVIHPSNTGDSSTRAVYHLKKGVFRVEWFFWERGGGDNGEFYSAKGAFANDADADTWALVGDNTPAQTFIGLGVDTNGWTVVSSDPGGDQLNTLADALADLAATQGTNVSTATELNVGDPDSNAGVIPFTKDTPGVAEDDFALKATANLVVTQTGEYEIGYTSDDGGWMKIPGQTFIEIVQNATTLGAITGPGEVQTDALTGASLTTVKVNQNAGTYPIEIGFFERGGGAFVRGMGAQFGAPSLPTLAAGGAGPFTTAAALTLTDRPAGNGRTAKGLYKPLGQHSDHRLEPSGWHPGDCLESKRHTDLDSGWIKQPYKYHNWGRSSLYRVRQP